MQYTSSQIGADPITGRYPLKHATDELDALAQFYHAFNTRDLLLLEHNWLTTDEASMSNPLGGIVRGWPAIREVYQRIFSSGAPLHVELHDYSLHIIGSMFYAIGREHGFVVANDQRTDVVARCTRLFRLDRGRWRQVHYHGSIEEPEILSAYRGFIPQKLNS